VPGSFSRSFTAVFSRQGISLPSGGHGYHRSYTGVSGSTRRSWSSRPALGPGAEQATAPIQRLTACAGTGVFCKQTPRRVRCGRRRPVADRDRAGRRPTATAAPTRRSGALLPSSLARCRSATCGHSPSPTCVGLRYGHPVRCRHGFSRRPPQTDRLRALLRARPDRGRAEERRRPVPRPPREHASPERSDRVSAVAQTGWRRNINRLPIAYAFRPQLRPG